MRSSPSKSTRPTRRPLGKPVALPRPILAAGLSAGPAGDHRLGVDVFGVLGPRLGGAVGVTTAPPALDPHQASGSRVTLWPSRSRADSTASSRIGIASDEKVTTELVVVDTLVQQMPDDDQDGVGDATTAFLWPRLRLARWWCAAREVSLVRAPARAASMRDQGGVGVRVGSGKAVVHGQLRSSGNDAGKVVLRSPFNGATTPSDIEAGNPTPSTGAGACSPRPTSAWTTRDAPSCSACCGPAIHGAR